MKVISGVYNLYKDGEKERMEKEIAEMLEDGYEIIACNMSFNPREKAAGSIYAEPEIFLMMKKKE